MLTRGRRRARRAAPVLVASWVAVLLAALAGALVVSARPAEAKSFRIESFVVDATLNRDGSMDVVEHITFDFDGEFSNGSRPIPPGDYDIVEMRASEAGRPLPSTGPPERFAWRYSAHDERRTFDIAYRVLRAAKVGPDVAELYWQWVGTDHPGADRLTATLRVPEGEGVVRGWGHGPLTGNVSVEDPVLVWQASGVPAGTFVEARVAVPAGRMSVAPTGEARLPAILAEETSLADAANRQRAADDERRRRIGQWFLLVPALGWVVFVVVWREWGREHEVGEVGDYVREPLDDPPAVARAVVSWGSVDSVAFSATVVDLAQRGALTITEERTDRWLLPDKVDWRFTRGRTLEDLRPYEAKVLKRLFAGGDETTQSELVEWAKDHQSEARRWWESWVGQVRTEFKRRHYQEGGRIVPFGLNLLAVIVVFAASAAALPYTPLAVVGMLSAIGQGAATFSLTRRTPAGARRAAEWKAFKRFLQDFSEMGDAPVGHLALWDRYLVYAVALGVADEVARGLAVRVPAEQRDHVGTWYSAADGAAGFSRLSAFGAGFGPTISRSFAPSESSSGSGGGGGFSGGGGGGGGGGGVGAS